MKRVLMTATVPSMIGQFNMNNIKILQELGYKVDVACNFDDYSVWNEERINRFENELKELNIRTFNTSFSRSPKNIKKLINSYIQIKNLLNSRKYTLVHTHTPISSLITRLAYKHSSIYESCKMVYTAHGFHFFKGNNPIKNLIFRNIEKIGAKYTDVLITINKEDYEAAKRFKLKKNGKVEYVPGVGIDLNKINSIKGDKRSLCKRLGIPLNTTLVLSVGELNSNKNHKIITFDFNGKKTAIQLSDIIYLESFLHEITIHTSSNFYKYSSTFNKMMSLINSTNIVRIHKSYAVNLFWVKEIYKEKLLLRNGVTLKIGKKYQQDVLASYKEYLLK